MNKGEVKARLRAIVKATRLNKRVEHEEQEWLLELLRETEEFRKVASSPGAWIETKMVKVKGVRRMKMLILRLRRLEVPVPQGKLLSALFPPRDAAKRDERVTHASAVRKALRGEIRPQIERFRQTVPWPVPCQLTGRMLWTWQGCDVDHTPALVELADRWVEKEGIKYRDIKLKGPRNAKYLVDTELAAKWHLFHEDNAKLAVVDSSANRAKGCGSYSPRDDLL